MSKQANIPTPEELAKLLEQVRQDKPYGIRDYTILHFSYYAGLRAKEIAKLMLQDVYEDGEIKEEAYLEAHQTKNTTDRKTGRKIFLQHPKLQRALSDYIKCESDESKLVSKRPLFISARGLSISADSMVHIIKRIYKRHGLHTLSSHSGRRYFATMLREEFPDMNAKELQDYGGWKSIAMAYQYIEVSPKKQQDRLKKATF